MSRIFDKRNYSQKTIETYEIMSAYYVDIFYNHLYTEAKKMKAAGNVVSVTEGYKHALNAFLKSLNNPKLYKKSIVGMHHYFMNIGFASISFSKCIDRITTEFIPTDYFQSLTTTKKMGVIRMVLNQSIKNFIRKVVDEHIGKIIDFHNEVDNVRILQDDLIHCFMVEREGMFQRFISNKTQTNKDETVNRVLAEKMQIEIKRLVNEKYTQQKQIITLKKIFLKRKQEETDEKTKINQIIENLQNQIETLKSQNNFYIQTQKSIANRSYNQVGGDSSINTGDHFIENVAPRIMENVAPRIMENGAIPRMSENTPKRYVNNLKVDIPNMLNNNSHHSHHIDDEPKFIDVNPNIRKIKDNIHSDTEFSQFMDSPHSVHDSPKHVVTAVEDTEYDIESSFIEVNSNNILSIIQNDSEELQKFNNLKMDRGTMLDAFE
jgi:hypothetical protein